MAPLDDTTKAKLANFVTQAAVAGGAAAMVAGPVEALVAAAAGGIASFAGVFIDGLAARDTRLATELFENMVMADDEPVELVMLLAEQLHSEDEEMLIKLRAVMRADLEAASPAALPAIARVGREYIRGYVPSWVARGWLRVLSEASSDEIDALGELARASVDCLAAVADVHRELRIPGQLGVTVLLTTAVSEVPGPSCVAGKPSSVAAVVQLRSASGPPRQRDRTLGHIRRAAGVRAADPAWRRIQSSGSDRSRQGARPQRNQAGPSNDRRGGAGPSVGPFRCRVTAVRRPNPWASSLIRLTFAERFRFDVMTP
jgi:hypothetical protein